MAREIEHDRQREGLEKSHEQARQQDLSREERSFVARSIEKCEGRRHENEKDAGTRAEADRKEIDESLQKVLTNEKSLAAESLRVHDRDIAKNPNGLHAALEKMGPEERLNVREQLIAEALATSAFNRDNYRELSKARTDKWDKLEEPQRLMVHQKAERLTAAIENREPCPVVAMLGDAKGEFDGRGGVIRLSRDVLKSSEAENTMALTHEQGHRKQLEAIRKPESAPELTASERKDLKDSWDSYKAGGPTLRQHIEYRDQLVERDARLLADERPKRMDDFKRRNGWE